MDTPRWVEQQVGVRLLRLHNAIYKGTSGRIGHRFIPGTPPNLVDLDQLRSPQRHG
ncbi:MAG: hypothetical protein JWM18_566, partial [Chloroflexi bacterium]|nr:hypothetical protein [Chloroflexota bacterium]